MRDPDLVLQAQQAAAALERAWQRWRAVHGLAADPVPPVSSYVGYSLEEPWGQPRVVFGLAAEEAERLAGLLDRHDCVGQVFAAMASAPADQQAPVRHGTGRAPAGGPPVRVPPQAPPSGADQPVASGRGPARSDRRAGAAPDDHRAESSDPLSGQRPSGPRHALDSGESGPAAGPAAGPPASSADDGACHDGPVFRAAAAAAAQAAARAAAAAAAQAAAARAVTVAQQVVADDGTGTGDLDAGQQAGGPGSGTAPGTGRDMPDDAAASDGLGGNMAGGAPSETAGPGPLTKAASAARAEAEARIRAALRRRRPAKGVEHPYPDPDLDRPHAPADTGTFDTFEALGELPGPFQASRPEVASGAFARPADLPRESPATQPPGAGPGWPGQENGVPTEVRQPAVVAFRPQQELAGYLDAGPEPDPFFDSAEDSAAPGSARRCWPARGHVIPRLPRAKRQGTAP